MHKCGCPYSRHDEQPDEPKGLVIDSGVAARAHVRRRILKAVNQLGNVSFLGLCGGGYDYGSGAADRNPPLTVTVYKFVPNTVTSLKVAKLNYTSAVGNSAPLTEG
jgi:hypothetical protein